MTRTEKIIAHLKAKGAQHLGDAGDKYETELFTEYKFRNLTRTTVVREWKSGLLEVWFLAHEICAGSANDEFRAMPDMDMVLRWINEETAPYRIEGTCA